MIQALITEIEYQLDRIGLYNDVPSKASLMVMMGSWAKQLTEVVNEYHHIDECHGSESEVYELRAELAAAEERIRQAKEIL